jgi:hypothetical protein
LRTRYIIIIITLMALIGLIYYFIFPMFQKSDASLTPFYNQSLILITSIMAVIYMLRITLNTSKNKSSTFQATDFSQEDFKQLMRLQNKNKSQIEMIKRDIDNHYFDVEKSDLHQLEERVSNHLEKELKQNIISEMEEKYSDQVMTDNKYRQLENLFEQSAGRLHFISSETTDRAKNNLAIGMTMSILAICYLLYFTLFEVSGSEEIEKQLPGIFTRYTLVVLLELFALFFLRLYKQGIADLKYFHNEQTNIEQKYLALKAALLFGTEKLPSSILEKLVTTERNFLLKKGESSIANEALKSDEKISQNILEALKLALDKGNGQ